MKTTTPAPATPTKTPRWAFMQKYVIRDPATGVPYLTRLRILQTPLFAFYLHWIHRPDADRDLHDHPFAFSSFILSGGYTEQSRLGFRVWRAGDVNRKAATEMHRIADVLPGTVTFVWCGRRVREWGFEVDGVWVPQGEYLNRSVINEGSGECPKTK